MKNLYHVYDPNNQNRVHAIFSETKPDFSINHSVNGQIDPRYDVENDLIIEGATPEKIDEYNKSLIPESISQMKLRMQLILSGISIASIYAMIESIADPVQKEIIYTKWEYAVVFDRTDVTLNQMAQMLGITPKQLDEIFINGNLL